YYGLGNDGVTVTLPPDDKLIRVNQLIARAAPDNFHWARIDFRTKRHYSALPESQWALYFGKTPEGELRFTLGKQ
ncbi:unnamed protein product, partial [Prorocentrum cordatum]